MVEVVDKNPSAEWLTSVKLGHGYDQSGEAVAEVPALSPRSALPPVSALSAAVAPPEAKSPPKQHVVPQA